MQDFFRTLSRALSGGQNAVLVSVLDASGSTPRGAGAMMAVFPDGSIAGTIGGGNVEFQAQRTAAELVKTGGSLIQSFRFVPGGETSLGMVCGGDQTLLFQTLSPAESGLFASLTDGERGGRDLWLVRRVENGTVTGTSVAARGGAVPDTLLRDRPAFQDGWFTIPAVRAGLVYLLGGGHVSQALARVLPPLGFRFAVFDDREEFASPALFPQAAGTLCGSFDTLTERISFTSDDYIVIMTRGHAADTQSLAATLRSGAKYIGCIGSRKKLALCRETLLAQGFTQEEWNTVHAPIGLSIGAQTPEEIAVSIAAELIAVRADVETGCSLSGR